MAKSPLGLERFIPQRDVRKLIWRHLTPEDREMVRCAQNSRRTPDWGNGAFQRACARHNYVALAEWAGCRCCWSEEALRYAAEAGHVTFLEWARTKAQYRCENDWQMRACAARHGRVDVLKWSNVECSKWNRKVCCAAAMHGKIAALEWLHDNVCDDFLTCSSIWGRFRPDVMQWVRTRLYFT